MKAGLVTLLLCILPGLTQAVTNTEARSQSTWFVDMNRFATSAHATFTCEECHGTMMEAGRKHPDPSEPDFLKKNATRTYDYRRCQKCHRLSYERYLAGEHAQALAKEKSSNAASKIESTGINKHAPTCGDCHVSHYVRSKLSRVSIGQENVHRCGKCHAEHAASYLDNIHGKLGVNLGNPDSAFCTDCHGAHTAVSLKKPEDALVVCRRCHPQAETEFTNFVIHASLTGDMAEKSSKKASVIWIKRIRIAAIAVVGLSFIFFFGHSVLWLLREIHQKLRKP
jgi:hypothetical protein